MPEFNQDIEIEITASDFIDECSEYEIDELFDELRERGYNLPKEIFKNNHQKTIGEMAFLEAIDKISSNFIRLSVEQEEQILNIAKSL